MSDFNRQNGPDGQNRAPLNSLRHQLPARTPQPIPWAAVAVGLALLLCLVTSILLLSRTNHPAAAPANITGAAKSAIDAGGLVDQIGSTP